MSYQTVRSNVTRLGFDATLLVASQQNASDPSIMDLLLSLQSLRCDSSLNSAEGAAQLCSPSDVEPIAQVILHQKSVTGELVGVSASHMPDAFQEAARLVRLTEWMNNVCSGAPGV